MPAFSKPRLMIAAAFGAGVAITAAFVAVGSGESARSQARTEAESSAPAINSGAEAGTGSWVDPNRSVTSADTTRVGSANLVFQPDALAEGDGGSTDRIKELATSLKVPVPPRRPEDFRVVSNSTDQDAHASVIDRRIRKVVVHNRADGTARNQKAAQANVQRRAESNEDAVRRGVSESRQRVTSTHADGVMQWLVEPSRF